MSLKSTTIAQVLRGAGYATGIFGKWHLGDAEPYQPGQRGFEETFIHGCGGIGQDYPGTCADAPGNTYFDPMIRHNGRFERTHGYAPLLKDPLAPWQDRFLFTHVGRWDTGKAKEAKYARCRLRSAQYSLVNSKQEKDWELYDLAVDPGESKNVSALHHETVARMDAAYARWWDEVLPLLENEDAVPPLIAPYKKLYFEQFGGGPGIIPRSARPL
jgi:arylsulfatase A-like enzyme